MFQHAEISLSFILILPFADKFAIVDKTRGFQAYFKKNTINQMTQFFPILVKLCHLNPLSVVVPTFKYTVELRY